MHPMKNILRRTCTGGQRQRSSGGRTSRAHPAERGRGREPNTSVRRAVSEKYSQLFRRRSHAIVSSRLLKTYQYALTIHRRLTTWRLVLSRAFIHYHCIRVKRSSRRKNVHQEDSKTARLSKIKHGCLQLIWRGFKKDQKVRTSRSETT